MKMVRAIVCGALLVLAAAALSGCVPGGGANNAGHAAGFFSGIWHGWIAPVSLVLSLFNKNYSIYEVYNNGFLYNLGYYMAVISGFGGLAVVRRRMKKK